MARRQYTDGQLIEMGGVPSFAASLAPPPSGAVRFEVEGFLFPGFVAGDCGHRIAESEWAAGWRDCERCDRKVRTTGPLYQLSIDATQGQVQGVLADIAWWPSTVTSPGNYFATNVYGHELELKRLAQEFSERGYRSDLDRA